MPVSRKPHPAFKPTALEDSLIRSSFDPTRPESFRRLHPSYPSFERFLHASFSNYRNSFDTNNRNLPLPIEPFPRTTQISDFSAIPGSSPESLPQPFIEPPPEDLPKHPRTLILQEQHDTTFESDVEYDNQNHPEMLMEVCKGVVEEESECPLSFLRAPGDVEGLDHFGFSLRQVLDILTDKTSESKAAAFEYTCRYCGAGFRTGCGLGGHVSKVHVGVKPKNKKKRILKDFKHFDKERSKFFRKLRK